MDQIMQFGPFQAIGKFWGTLNNTQRFITAVFISLSIALLIVVSVVATRPQMTVLFSGLSSSDAGAVVSKIQSQNIPYEVSGDGSVVKVPSKNVAELRMGLASEGLPQGGSVGFEIFDKTSLGMTEFSQRLNYQRALQGELSRSINQLGGVEQSRVHIAIPEKSVFARKDNKPTASVIVKLLPGGSLGTDQVGGIVHLVSSAVEGLKTNDVTVVDTNGNVLSKAFDETSGLNPKLTATQLGLKREHERIVEKDIQSMLERVLGPGKAIVRVNAKINFDRKETNSQTFQPAEDGKGVLLSEVSLAETYGNQREAGNAIASIADGEEGGYQRIETTTKYEVSRMTEHVITAPGQIENLSVAVMVDDQVEGGKIDSIRNAVTMAAGIDLERGDQITVESIAFDTSAYEAEATEFKEIASRSTYMSIGKTAGAVLLLFAFLFFVKSMLGRVNVSIPQVTVQEVSSNEGAATMTGAPSQQVAQAYESSSSPLSSFNPEQLPPEEVAQIVKNWMSEE